MFSDVMTDFNDRVTEVDLYFQVLAALDNDEIAIVKGNGPQVVPIGASPADWGRMLKGGAYLVLYNMVEAFIRRGFKELFDSIQSDGLCADKLTQLMRHQWIHQRNRKVSAFDGSPKVYMKLAFEMIEEILNGTIAELNPEQLPISGNLDADVIREVCTLHGVPVKTPAAAKGGVELATVKTKRNYLAHGNESFVDCGRNLTAVDLIRVKDEVVAFVRGILTNLEQFVNNKDYKL
jgi:hypothetical protein